MKSLSLTAAVLVAALALTAQALAAKPSSPFITDTLAPGGGKVAPQHAQGYRFITDTLAPGGGAGTTQTVDTTSGFSWSAAGIGALTTVGVLLVIGGAGLTAVRRRTVVTG